MPIARRIAPRAALLGVRGRATEEGTNRWFRRVDDTTFDQSDIHGETAAFRAFVDGAVAGYGLDPDRLAFLGYSNGANLLAAVIQLHPGLVRRAVLLRSFQVLQGPPAADLSGTMLLLLNGRDDPWTRNGPALDEVLRSRSARVEAHELPVDHTLAAADLTEAARWIGRNLSGGLHA
jgi:phospholipase/carboxylesterase